MPIEAGTFRHRVTVQKPVYTQDQSTGAMTPVWTQVCQAWAAIEPLSARDLIAAQAQQSKVIARVVMRYRADIAADQRILHGGKIYSIEGVLPDKDSGLEYLTLPVSHGVKES